MAEVKPLTTKTLAQKILNGKEVFILDIRKEDDYSDWKIEGENVKSLNVPLKQLKDEVEDIKEELPHDQTIYVVCARGISSQDGVEILKNAGVENITYLEGGMTAWSEHLEPVKVANLPDGGEIYQFLRIGKGCLSYMIINTGEAAVIDPVRMTDIYKRFAEDKQASIHSVLDTHLHADHISGGKTLADQVNADYYFPEDEEENIEFTYKKTTNNTEIKVGTSETISALHSPGHTPGSTSFIINNQYILTGDTLFIESVGRPDLAGKADEWVKDLYETLYAKYPELPQDLIVLPGHFGAMEEINEDGTVQAKLEDLYKQNDRLQVEDESEFQNIITDQLPSQPNSHEKIREVNMGKRNPDDDARQEMEIGPNRCAV
ncbi:MBL fold metallo-hydrolase [Virgibacillus halodenitrificans]|uniref:MBL fold metallo-hydrolase n=1 Tax=Virgibacillus halodenitrificans TaxID=1482 RepID=UPI001F250442|nr:MBL fold metallo-hydrolase [Virgibacillus halodenitrificans]